MADATDPERTPARASDAVPNATVIISTPIEKASRTATATPRPNKSRTVRTRSSIVEGCPRCVPRIPRSERLRGGPKLGAVIELVAFDGDDTLWHNESIFSMTQERFRELMQPYVGEHDLDDRLLATEMRNLRLFGYGVKSFTLSMIETAIELSDARVMADEIAAILHAGRSMLEHPVDLLDGAVAAIEAVSGGHPVMLITKGDLFDQESKLARSGLGDRFEAVEIGAEKDERAYERLLERRGVAPEGFVMVGNPARSDVQPTLALGAFAVHVPYPLTWAHEQVDETTIDGHARYRRIASLADLPDVLDRLD